MISMPTLYLISLITAFLCLLFALTFMSNKANGTFLLLLFSLVAATFGYYRLSIAQTVEEAILAKQITYFDGTLVSFIMLISIMRICNIKVPRWLSSLGVLYSGLVFGLAMTIGRSNLFYYDISISFENGLTLFHKQNGPLHSVLTIGLILNMVLVTAVVIYSFFRRNEVSYIHSIILGLLVLATAGTYFIERIVHAKFEYLPLAYNISEIFLVILILRVDKYEISNDILSAIERLGEHGYIVLDKNKRYVGRDETSVYFFPELKKAEIDRIVTEPFLRDNFIVLADELDQNIMEPRYFERDGRILKCSARRYSYGHILEQEGYIIEILDDTENQQHVEILNKYNEDLKEAVAAAEVANEAKSNFLSKMSHEIRTPINAINGMTEMILRESNQAEVLEYANDVKSSSNMLLALVNDVLDFSKIEAGKMELNIVTYRLANVIHDVDIMMRSRAVDKGLIFELKADPDTPCYLIGDDMRIKQIFVNLVSNAVKYTDKGTVIFSVNYERISDDEMYLIVSVKDTGRGIKTESLPSLFDSFKRLDEVKNVGIEGTGLGLSITKQFTELMGGTIDVTSTYGEGSEFTVKIPQRIEGIATLRDCEHTKTADTKQYNEQFTLPGFKVLVVDDTKMNLKVFASLLKKTQIEVDTAASGAEAIEKCHSNKYHMIFMDHMMPEMDGIQCYEALLADEANLNKEAPVIMLTANAISGMREMYLSHGFTDYIAKPFQMAELTKVISDHIPADYAV